MPEVYHMFWDEFRSRANELLSKLREFDSPVKVCCIPNGGMYLAPFLVPHQWIRLTENPNEANALVDDVYDSGSTTERYTNWFGPKTFLYLVDKRVELKDKWVTFPWERADKSKPTGAEDAVVRMLQFIGERPEREGLKDTPKRVVKAWTEMSSGYKEKPEDVLTVFEEDSSDEMVILKDIEFVSHCEHHILPFYGRASVAYVPNGKVIGVSKLARMFDIYAKRLQIQERLCQQVTKALNDCLKPLGSACVIEASHMCMVCRGVKKQHSKMITSSLTGVFKEDLKARSEFLHFIR